MDWDTVKGFSQAIVQHLSRVSRSVLSPKAGRATGSARSSRTTCATVSAPPPCAWSVRARPGMGVSVPVTWEELDKLTNAAHWHARNIGERLDAGNAPWDTYETSRAPLPAAMKAMDFKPAAARSAKA
jgi:bifunctional non-homologous end joining protein LigD